MIVITDRDLLGAGLDYETALALMGPAEGELVVHVHMELSQPRPTSPAIEPVGTSQPPATAGIPSRVIATDCASDAARGMSLNDAERKAAGLR